jgi:hypothetical protein
MARRDDFSQQIKRTLAQRVGYICSNPKCRTSTSGPHTIPSKSIIVGVAAHITAAAPGGPRYDPNLLETQRRSPENGIWLCQNCAKLIDSDWNLFTKEILFSWKFQAEESQFQKISAPPLDDQIEDKEKRATLKALILKSGGAGFHAFFDNDVEIPVGTISFRIFNVAFQEDIKILDFIGGITQNRISLIIKHNQTAHLNILDRQGNSSAVNFVPNQANIASVVTLTWHINEISLWWMNEKVIQQSLPYQIGKKWVVVVCGIDVDGINQASYIVKGVRGGGITGLGLCASNKNLQLIISDLAVWRTVLTDDEIRGLVRGHLQDVYS